jgi:hypothetical protein
MIPKFTISPVEVKADHDASPAAADDDGTTFVYTEGATVPNDVVRLRVDPSLVVVPPRACIGRKNLIEVTFPEGKLREIGYQAFAHCTALEGGAAFAELLVYDSTGSLRVLHVIGKGDLPGRPQ